VTVPPRIMALAGPWQPAPSGAADSFDA